VFSNLLKLCPLCFKFEEMLTFKNTVGCQEIGKGEYTVLDSFCRSWQEKCILSSIEFYRSGSASRMILVKFGKETSTGYAWLCLHYIISLFTFESSIVLALITLYQYINTYFP
jgi:hypothetical protein